MENLEFSKLFVGASAFFHPYRISDHTSAILRVPMHSPTRPRTFKFSNILVQHPHFKEIVLIEWQSHVSGFWMNELNEVQHALDYDPSNHELREEEAVYLNAFNEDSLVKSQASRNRTDSIMMYNGDCVTGDQAPIAFIDHYTAFLGQWGVTCPMASTNLFSNQLLNDVSKSMIRAISKDEIRDDIFSMGDDKSSSPDGYSTEFFVNEVLLKELNHTIIALIPKVATPMKINDYRPISCCNVLVKCISKILSNCMKDSLTGLVSLNQSAFVSGRRISDNIFLTQELMHNYHLDRGPPRCAFKVDIQKAYDTVDWDFLKYVLAGFGFHPRMIGWIMKCVTTTYFSLSINGLLHGFFKGMRGLRQGDPMSPYLFTLVMEVLTLMLHKRVIMDTLEEFKTASGLTPSLPKSTAYLCNVLNHVKIDILGILLFEEGKLPVKYLGVPLVPSRLLYRDCTELVEKVKKRISDWKNKYLSLAGKVKCGKLRPKLRGRVPVCLKMKEALVKWIHIYKLRGRSLWEILLRGKMSWGWCKILQVRPLVRQSIWYRLGYGLKVSTWYDNWCPFSLLSAKVNNGISNRDIYEARFQLSAKVNNVIMNGNWLWLNDWHSKFCMLYSMVVPHLNPHANDSLYWKDLRKLEVGFRLLLRGIPLGLVVFGDHLKPYMRMPNIPLSLSLIVDFLLPLASKKSARIIIVKLVFAAAFYFIWHERNNRLFAQHKRTPDQVIDSIISTVRLKLISCKFKKTENVQRILRIWKIPNSILNPH
ncbi:hypothetical protein Tco_1104486 [Tanacetum coccineum]